MRSGSDEAWRWGTPSASRRTVTGAVRPGSRTSPSTCGSARRDQRQYTATPRTTRRAVAKRTHPAARRRRSARGRRAGAGGGAERAAALVVIIEGWSLTRVAPEWGRQNVQRAGERAGEAGAVGTRLGHVREPAGIPQGDAVTPQQAPVLVLARDEGLQGGAVGVRGHDLARAVPHDVVGEHPEVVPARLDEQDVHLRVLGLVALEPVLHPAVERDAQHLGQDAGGALPTEVRAHRARA